MKEIKPVQRSLWFQQRDSVSLNVRFRSFKCIIGKNISEIGKIWLHASHNNSRTFPDLRLGWSSLSSPPHPYPTLCWSPELLLSLFLFSLPHHITVTKWLKPYRIHWVGQKQVLWQLGKLTMSSESQGAITGWKSFTELREESVMHLFSNIHFADSITSFRSGQVSPFQWGPLWWCNCLTFNPISWHSWSFLLCFLLSMAVTIF